MVVQSLTSGTRRTVVERGSDARYLPSGHLVYAVEGTLFAVPFDANRHRVTGDPVPVVVSVRGSLTAESVQFCVSNTGSLVYIAGPATSSDSQRVPRSLVLASRSGPARPFSLPPGPYSHPGVSPDGLRVAYARDNDREGAGADIWIYELAETSAPQRLTFGGRNRFPVWSSDGKRIAFQSDREGDLGIFQQTADGGTAERLTTPEKGDTHTPESWSPDGKHLLYAVSNGTRFSLWALTVADRTAAPVADVWSGAPLGSVFSPDGRWLAYSFDERGGVNRSPNRGVYIIPFPATGVKFLAPKGVGAYHPAWAPGGRELFYAPSASGFMVAVTVRPEPSVTFGNPVELRAVPRPMMESTNVRAYDVLPDGRFIIATPSVELNASGTPEAPEIHVVLNWFEELKRLVPAK